MATASKDELPLFHCDKCNRAFKGGMRIGAPVLWQAFTCPACGVPMREWWPADRPDSAGEAP